ncbi:MAG: redox-regulated ATPase YchF [Dehalococcoidia bacterium]|nr:redox-regulated ATPase YchF [Dehalococcoidia bacterium]
MELGIIGLPKSGKTTTFNALTRGHAEAGDASAKPNIGVAKVPDPRLDFLASVFKPKRVVPAEVRYIDIPGAPEGLGRSGDLGGRYLNSLQSCDALLHVVRAFNDPSVPHVEGYTDPYRDISTMDLELTFSDLAILERRSERLTAELKGIKAQERNRVQGEAALIERLKQALSQDTPLREQNLTLDEGNMISGYQFLTGKPLLILQNVDEEQTPNLLELEEEMSLRLNARSVGCAVMCGILEEELSQMDPEEEEGYRRSQKACEPGADRMIKLSYSQLNLVSFLTVGPDEVRAWSIPEGTPAAKAAGVIHSDMERGFIRAEVISYDDLARCGGMVEARRRGVLRAEGRGYPVQDGYIINFLFNV